MSIRISIKKIEISITGLPDKIAKRSFVGLDKELSAQGSKFFKGNYSLVQNSNTINGGNLHVRSDIQPGHLRRLVAQRILKSMVRESL